MCQHDVASWRSKKQLTIYGREVNGKMFLPLKMCSFIHSDYNDITFVTIIILALSGEG